MIAQGIAEAFERLTAMRASDGTAALDFLKGVPPDSRIVVTGHSLGGCLASLVPIWLRTELEATVTPCTFAGQSAGNAQFAKYFETLFGTRVRYFNTLDVVPRAWNHDDLDSIKQLFPKPGPQCDLLEKGLVDLAMVSAGRHYQQPTSNAFLPGAAYDESGLFEFAEEIEQQHHTANYMYLTGIPVSVIRGTPEHPGLAPDWTPPPAREKSAGA